jgi:Raf kinase inhibitor-like YbhB/YbcL family protein
MSLISCIRVGIAVMAFQCFGIAEVKGEEFGEFRLSSQAFKEMEEIPTKYTCHGMNISPQLTWGAPPRETKSFALIVDDPDAPGGIKIHWVVYNIPPTVFSCKEGEAPAGSLEGLNDQGKPKYRGPCPPDRKHRYFFKLYALKEPLNLPKGATKQQVEEAMQSLVLGKAELVGVYGPPAKENH